MRVAGCDGYGPDDEGWELDVGRYANSWGSLWDRYDLAGVARSVPEQGATASDLRGWQNSRRSPIMPREAQVATRTRVGLEEAPRE